jgi:broad specificity phosphatase PhoE
MSLRITYFVHGTTTDNEKELATGWNPGQLSNKGVEQSKALFDMIDDPSFDVVFCSDLKRAIDSAEIAFEDRFPIIHDERIRECNYGDNNGGDATEFKNRMEDFINQPFPNGESYKDVEERMRSFVEMLKNDYDGKHVAIVAHQGPQLALDVILRGKSWEEAIHEDWRKQKAWKPGWTYIVE